MPELTIQSILVEDLVPGERELDRDVIDRLKASIACGRWETPRVIHIDGLYYVADGNHRIMAAIELGKQSVDCRVQEFKPKKNVESFDRDDCMQAVESGHRGFKGLEIVSGKDRSASDIEDDSLI